MRLKIPSLSFGKTFGVFTAGQKLTRFYHVHVLNCVMPVV